MKTLKGHGLKASEALYRVIVASTFAFSTLVFLLALVAIAVHAKAIDVQHIHTAPQF